MAHASAIVRLADGKLVDREQAAARRRRGIGGAPDVSAGSTPWGSSPRSRSANLFASRLKTFIVGGIIFFGALLVVVGHLAARQRQRRR